MKKVFADTLYWIAVVRPNDPWAGPAKRARASLGEIRLVTTDEVLTEFLAAFSKGGEKIRKQAVQMVRAILANPIVQVVAQSHESFLQGLELYSERPDKEYSLTDCISMNTMRSESIEDVLSNDHHFTQEGFTVLISTGKMPSRGIGN